MPEVWCVLWKTSRDRVVQNSALRTNGRLPRIRAFLFNLQGSGVSDDTTVSETEYSFDQGRVHTKVLEASDGCQIFSSICYRLAISTTVVYRFLACIMVVRPRGRQRHNMRDIQRSQERRKC